MMKFFSAFHLHTDMRKDRRYVVLGMNHRGNYSLGFCGQNWFQLTICSFLYNILAILWIYLPTFLLLVILIKNVHISCQNCSQVRRFSSFLMSACIPTLLLVWIKRNQANLSLSLVELDLEQSLASITQFLFKTIFDKSVESDN